MDTLDTFWQNQQLFFSMDNRFTSYHQQNIQKVEKIESIHVYRKQVMDLSFLFFLLYKLHTMKANHEVQGWCL